MTESTVTWRPRKAAGPDRPSYLGEADVDRVMAVLLALISEVAAIRERLDTHERLAQAGIEPAPGEIDAYAADAQAEAAREVWRDGFIRRLFRVFTEDIEDLRAKDKSSSP